MAILSEMDDAYVTEAAGAAASALSSPAKDAQAKLRELRALSAQLLDE